MLCFIIKIEFIDQYFIKYTVFDQSQKKIEFYNIIFIINTSMNNQWKNGGGGAEIQFNGQKPRFFSKKKDTNADDAAGFQKGTEIG